MYTNGTVKLINHNRHGIRIVIHQVRRHHRCMHDVRVFVDVAQHFASTGTNSDTPLLLIPLQSFAIRPARRQWSTRRFVPVVSWKRCEFFFQIQNSAAFVLEQKSDFVHLILQEALVSLVTSLGLLAVASKRIRPSVPIV